MKVGIFGLLGILFVALKLLGYITWSWWLVLLPFYGGLVVVAFFGLISLIFFTIHYFLGNSK